MSIYSAFASAREERRKLFAVLLDPDKTAAAHHQALAGKMEMAGVDFILAGGSLLSNIRLGEWLESLKQHTRLPVVLFPGGLMQIDHRADAILLLSLISGRNPDLLIGKHVEAAPYLKASGLEILPTGYMLIGEHNATTAGYMSHSMPIPSAKGDIAAWTALAGEMLGLKMIYLDAGSGAASPVPLPMISRVRQELKLPLMVGGGIRTPEQAGKAWESGADIVVAGNAIEQDPSLILKFCAEKEKIF